MDEAGSLVATFGHESALDWAILRNASIFISDFNRFYVYVSSILVWQFPHRGTTTSLSILKIHLEFLSKIDSTAVFTRWNHFSNEAQSHLARLSFCFHSCADVLFQSPFRKPYDFSFFASVLSLRFAFSSSVQICTLYTKTLLRIVVWMLAKRMGGVMCHQGFPCCLELFWERDPGTQQSLGLVFPKDSRMLLQNEVEGAGLLWRFKLCLLIHFIQGGAATHCWSKFHPTGWTWANLKEI